MDHTRFSPVPENAIGPGRLFDEGNFSNWKEKHTTTWAWSCSIGFYVPTSRFYGSGLGTHVQLEGAAFCSEGTDDLNQRKGFATGTDSTQGHETGHSQQKDYELVQDHKFGVTSDSASSSVSSSVTASELGRHFYLEWVLVLNFNCFILLFHYKENIGTGEARTKIWLVISGSLLIQLTRKEGS